MAQYVQLGSPANVPQAANLLNAINQLRSGFTALQSISAKMVAMETNGGGDTTANYDQIATLFGIQQGTFASADAAAMYLNNEILSTVGNSAALLQLLSECG